MSADSTPWSTEVDRAGDRVVVRVMLSLDAGPMREFRPFLDVELDEAHATELLGKLSLALRRSDQRTTESPSGSSKQPDTVYQLFCRCKCGNCSLPAKPRPDREQ